MAGVALLAVRNRETSKELAEGRTLGSLAMQEEAHELKVLERVGRDHPRAKKVHMDLKPHPILKTNLAEVPPKHLKIKNTRSSSESSNAGDGWKNLGAVSVLVVAVILFGISLLDTLVTGCRTQHF